MKIDTGWFQVAIIVGVTWGFAAAVISSSFKLIRDRRK